MPIENFHRGWYTDTRSGNRLPVKGDFKVNGIVIVEGRDLGYLRVGLTDPMVRRLRVHIEPEGRVKFKTNEAMWTAGVGRWDVPPPAITLANLDPDSQRVEAPIHLQLKDAIKLRDQLTYLIDHHYQLRD